MTMVRENNFTDKKFWSNHWAGYQQITPPR